MIDLSIIVVNWNTKTLLRHCLESVYQTTRDATFEIIVVDNASSDGSIEILEEEFRDVKLIKNTVNRGFAAANNQGIKQAVGEFILLLNSDTVVLEEALDETVSFMREYSDAAALGCRLLNSDGSLQPSCYNFPSFLRAILHKSRLTHLIPRIYRSNCEGLINSWDYTSIRRVGYVRGAFLLLRAEVLQKVGLLDEQFFLYAEEADLCLRLKKAGYQTYFYPKAEVIHLGGGSTKDNLAKMSLQRAIASLLLKKKHWAYSLYLLYRAGSLVATSLTYICVKLILQDKSRSHVLKSKLQGIWKMDYDVEG